VQEEDVMVWWLRTRKLIAKQVRKGFDSLVFLVGWRLWKERTFTGVSTCARGLVSAILSEAEEWCPAGFKHLLSLVTLL
jgi:hypothetical protein